MVNIMLVNGGLFYFIFQAGIGITETNLQPFIFQGRLSELKKLPEVLEKKNEPFRKADKNVFTNLYEIIL